MFLKVALIEVVLLIITIPMLYMGYETSHKNFDIVKNMQIQSMVVNLLNRNKNISLLDEENLCIDNNLDLIKYQNTSKGDFTCLNFVIGSKNKLIIRNLSNGEKEITLQKMDWINFKNIFTLNF